MGNLNLVTGYKGEAHVTAADQGSFNAAIFGAGSYVLNRGNKFAALVVSNNSIRIQDGDICLQGRHVRLAEGTYVDLAIENGNQGYKRNDLIVARYTKSAQGVEDCNLVVIKGTASTSAAADPEYTAGDIINDHDTQADFPLYRVPIDGITVGTLVPLFSVIDSTLDMAANAVPSSRKVAGITLANDIAAAALLTALCSGQVVIPYDNSNLVGSALPAAGTKGRIYLLKKV